MHKGRKNALIFVAIAGVATVTYFGFTRESPNIGNERRSLPATAPSLPATASKEATPAVGQRRERRYTDFVQTAIGEIQFSPDIRATYSKYRSYADPSGEIAFRLHIALGECIHFVDKSVDQISREMNPVGKVADQSSPRRTAIERQIQRCKGFQGDTSAVNQAANEQLRRATDLGNPGAIASNLVVRAVIEKPEQIDHDAIRLLSANVDEAVINGIFLYLRTRNSDAWMSQFGDPDITTAAWLLLQCNYGAPCDDRSPLVLSACIKYAACDQHDVESALPYLYPSLTPARVQEAIRVQSLLASYIQNRDWVRLGFDKRELANPK